MTDGGNGEAPEPNKTRFGTQESMDRVIAPLITVLGWIRGSFLLFLISLGVVLFGIGVVLGTGVSAGLLGLIGVSLVFLPAIGYLLLWLSAY